MRVIAKQRICGNCGRSVVNRAHGVIIKSFRCDIDMEWVTFDCSCKDHKFPEEIETILEQNTKKPEAIDLEQIPDSIRPKNSSELQRDAENPAGAEE